MTIIAAAIGPDGTWIGSDGLVVRDMVTATDAQKIIFSPDNAWAIGCSGTAAVQSALEASPLLWTGIGPPSREEAAALLTRIREILDAAGARPGPDGDCSLPDYHFTPLVIGVEVGPLIACSTLISYSAASAERCDAVGEAREYAVGAMHGMRTAGCRSAETMVRMAVQMSCERYAYCGGQIMVRRLGDRGDLTAIAEAAAEFRATMPDADEGGRG